MGEITVDIELENAMDRIMAEDGHLPEAGIRRITIAAIADTDTMMLALPEDVVSQLGLRLDSSVNVIYADGRRDQLPVAALVNVQLCNRRTVADCIVLPQGSDARVGQIITRQLDLIPDPETKTLGPRPESLDRPLIRLYPRTRHPHAPSSVTLDPSYPRQARV